MCQSFDISHEASLWGPKCCYFSSRSEFQYGHTDWLTHFELLLQNSSRDLLQTRHKCSLWGPDQVLLLLKTIWSPIWPPWPLIGWNILIFSRTLEGIYSKLGTNVPYEVPTKCCYFSSWSKFQYGHPGLWLADTFWTSSQEWLKRSSPSLAQMNKRRTLLVLGHLFQVSVVAHGPLVF